MTSRQFTAYTDLLKQRVSEHRLRHSVGVMEEAAQLARIHGADVSKAEIAGLMHDMTKEFSKKEHFRLFEKYHFPLDDNLRTNKNLWHAASGSCDVTETLGITDPEIISAVRYHTTGRANMPLLDAILYVADLTEQNRDYSDVAFYRALARQDLYKTAYLAMGWCIEDLNKRQLPVHRNMLEGFAQLEEQYPGVTVENEKEKMNFRI